MGGGASQTAASAVSFQMWAEWEGLNESQWEEPVSQNNQVCLKSSLKQDSSIVFRLRRLNSLKCNYVSAGGGASELGRGASCEWHALIQKSLDTRRRRVSLFSNYSNSRSGNLAACRWSHDAVSWQVEVNKCGWSSADELQ